MEIQVGEYIRTLDGIKKIVKINEGKLSTYYGKYIVFPEYKNSKSINVKNIIKHSFNIIDLIEKGDYVNGYKVLDIDFKNEMICLLMPFDEENKSKYNIVWNTKYFIKSIVTKEMFQNIEYRVESN